MTTHLNSSLVGVGLYSKLALCGESGSTLCDSPRNDAASRASLGTLVDTFCGKSGRCFSATARRVPDPVQYPLHHIAWASVFTRMA